MFWVLIPYQINDLQKFSFILWGIFFIFLMVSFAAQSFKFDEIQFAYFSSVVCAFAVRKVIYTCVPFRVS